ncbi:MAG: hypothetical protein IIZ64_03245 [Erysipelotrichaceae bacterium]|nr:hypothetical protein [Erysipelotrichaceae bacterium]MBQ1533815.1 hypothetical protein [Erysipelotrichaceae bacterium]MBQ1787795.1 hypothetical protein [Erysipelotrichaceae bacterium]
MRIRNKQLYILNVVAAVLLLIPLGRLQLFNENYSTLSLNTRGYLYLLMTGILCGLTLAYETSAIGGKKRAVWIFLGLFLGTLIPHHYPYDLQGNIHLFLAYSGFCIMIGVTYLNLFQSYRKRLTNIYVLSLAAAFVLYLQAGMVNTLSELIIMSATLGVNLLLYIKKQDHSCF